MGTASQMFKVVFTPSVFLKYQHSLKEPNAQSQRPNPLAFDPIAAVGGDETELQGPLFVLRGRGPTRGFV